jgi:hypothetical protein
MASRPNSSIRSSSARACADPRKMGAASSVRTRVSRVASADLIAAEHEAHSVREWLLFLARTAANDVAGRLERSGYVKRAGGRWRPGRWVPVDPDWAFSAPLTAGALLQQLHALGVQATQTRTAAFRQLVLQAPASVVAQALGCAPETAEGHVRDGGGTWSRYPATRTQQAHRKSGAPGGQKACPTPTDRCHSGFI